MIRVSSLLPAFALALGLAGASLAMADDSNSASAAPHHDNASATKHANACSDAPIYRRPAYCQPHGK